jgi:hypothetical protein
MTTSASQVASGGSVTFNLTITNPTGRVQVCEIDDSGLKPRRICYYEPVGAATSGVVLSDSLPAGATYQGATADSGFVCGASGTTVTCSGGHVAQDGVAHIAITAAMPALAPGGANQTLTNAATVNPSQTINERTYANNSASASVTDVAPPPLLPDLVVTGFSGPGSVPQGGTATFTVNVANIGQGTANGVAVLVDGGYNTWNITSSSGTSGFTPCYSSPERFSLRAWCPGFGNGPSLAPGATATMTINVQIPSTPGTFTMSATVDPYNSIAESNENNNQQTLVMQVY